MHRYLRTRLGHPQKQFFLLQLRGVCHSRGCGSENADGAGLKESTLRIVDVLKDTVSRCA